MPEKKIIYVHTGEWPSPSPSIVFVTGTICGLAQHTPSTLIIRNNSEESTDSIFRKITDADMPENLDIMRIGKGGKTPRHGSFFREAFRRIGDMADRGEAGAIISRNIGFLPYMYYLRKRFNIPCLFETHDYYGDLSFRTDVKKTLHIRRNSRFERYFLPKLDGIICLTKVQSELFKKHYPDTPIVIANTGIMRVVRSEKPRENLICYIGSLEPHKGLGTILAALSQTVDQEVGLFIIGGKDEREIRGFLDLARLMRVENRVRISGWMHHSDVGHMIDRCRAGLVAIQDTPFNRHLTSPLKILDYLGRSLPVIASDLPPVHDYMENGKHGLFFNPDNSESLAEALDRYTALNMFETMSPEVEKHAHNYLWEKRGKTILSFIDSLKR